METGGLDIGGSADQFHFLYRPISGDFDVRTRVQTIEGGDLWAKAGIMARLNLEPSSAAVSVVATPSLLGCFKIARPTETAMAVISDSIPGGYPHLWLRLQRTNGIIRAYTGVDGICWFPTGSPTEGLDQPLLLGLAACSHKTNQLTKVLFSDFGNVENPALGELPLKSELPGPTSRRTGLTISEIMYHGPGDQGEDLEFIELFNSNPFF